MNKNYIYFDLRCKKQRNIKKSLMLHRRSQHTGACASWHAWIRAASNFLLLLLLLTLTKHLIQRHKHDKNLKYLIKNI